MLKQPGQSKPQPEGMFQGPGAPAGRAKPLMPSALRRLRAMSSPTTPGDGLPVMLFETQADFEAWLDEHHASSSGAWLRLAKKASGLRSLSYDEAVEAGLCFGWIDGQKKGYDERSWLRRFTPRGPQSIWSKVNRAKDEALIAAGRVRPA